MREVRTLLIDEERHPVENEVWQAYEFACQKCCVVELKWFVPHYGFKVWIIKPEDNIQDLLKNLHLITVNE